MFLATLLVTKAAEEGPPPLIDLDLTVVVQFVLFLVLLTILSRWLFAPYLKLRAARHDNIEGATEKAHEMDERGRQIVATYEERMMRARLRGADERTRLRTDGAAHERQVLGAARDEAQRAIASARAKIGADTQAARTKLAAESTQLARQMATKILGREVA